MLSDMWFLMCDDSVTSEPYCIGVFKELSDVCRSVAKSFYDVPEKKLYVVKASNEQYFFRKPNKYQGTVEYYPKE